MAAKRDDAATEKDQRAGEDRRSGDDRRDDGERRAEDLGHEPERRSGTDRRAQKGPDGERRKAERRINEYRLRPEVLEFINAVNEFKSVRQKPFPTWSEIYDIFVQLGYRRASKAE